MPKKKTSRSSSKPDKLTLDDAIIALQKTFSRVSAQSAQVPAGNARALVTGEVEFTLTLNADLEDDYWCIAQTGGQQLNLKGSINTDIRVIENESSEKES